MEIVTCDFCGMPPGPRFFMQIFGSKWRNSSGSRGGAAVSWGLAGTFQGQLIGKVVTFQVPRSSTGAFLKRKLKRQNTVTTPSTHENNKTHVQYCFITVFGRKGQNVKNKLPTKRGEGREAIPDTGVTPVPPYHGIGSCRSRAEHHTLHPCNA